MFYYNKGGTANILSPVQKTVGVVFQKLSVIFRHMFWYINRFRRVQLTHMRCNTVVMVKNFNTVFSDTDIDLLTDKFIRDRILAISDFYEIIGLYGGS